MLELNAKRKLYAEMLVRGEKSLTEMSEALGVTVQSLVSWRKETAVKEYMEKIQRDNIPLDLNGIESMTPLQLSALRRKIEQVERTLDPSKNLLSVLHRNLGEMEDKDEQRNLFKEVLEIFSEFDLQPVEKFNEIIVCGVPSDQDLKEYVKQCIEVEKWCKENNIVLPDKWDIIRNIYKNATSGIKLE